jgi:MscS family membrane protein
VFVTRIITFLVLCYAFSLPVGGQEPPAEPQAKPAPAKEAIRDPLNRLSPQSSAMGFLERCRNKEFERAARFLNLTNLGDRRFAEGPALARQLSMVLDRDAEFDLAGLSSLPEGDVADGLPPNRDRVRVYQMGGKSVAVEMERIEARSGAMTWVFSAETVRALPLLMQVTSDSPIEKYLPTILVTWTLGGSPVWRWLAVLLAVVLGWALSGVLTKLILIPIQLISRRLTRRPTSEATQTLYGPIRLLLCVGILGGAVEIVAPTAMARLYLGRVLALVFFIGLAWLLLRLVDLSLGRIRTVMETRHSSFSKSALPLASRVVKTTIVMLAITAVLSAWGYNTTTILAGLGIGGIAIALAAQKTIENLFGGVAVISDRPVRVGDFCKFGDRVGTVEDVGLRSTRIRTLDRTMVSVPNAEFSAMVLENFAWRDKMWFHPTFNLRKDTSPDKIRRVLDEIHRILTTHPKVEAGPLCVRFIGASQNSLDIETFAYVKTPNGDEFLAVQQEIWLQIMDALERNGTSLAAPSEVNVFYNQAAAVQAHSKADGSAMTVRETPSDYRR